MLTPDVDRQQIALRDAEARTYDAWYGQRRWWAQVEMAELIDRLTPESTDVIADIGCGTGRLVEALAPRVARIYAFDFSQASVAVLDAKCVAMPWRARVSTAVADMSQRLDLASASIDKVVSLQAYQHVQPPGRRAALGEFARILKPGGRLYLVVYSYPSWVFGPTVPAEGLIADAIYFRRWSRQELHAELRQAGWQVVGIHPILCWPQLRRLGDLGAQIERLVHRWGGPLRYPAYWLAEATPANVVAAS